jgi:hypothetical protein
MANSTISSLTSISTPSSAGMLWISDPNASPQDRSWAISAIQAMFGRRRNVVSTSGTLGTLTVLWDTDYVLTAASTVTLPLSPLAGCRLTFKCKGAFGITITANTGQVIGSSGASATNSIGITGTGAFITLEWDSTNSLWHVVASSVSVINSASGVLGTAIQITDSFYEFTATGSMTLPLYPENGTIYTIKNKSSGTITINASVATVVQTIGTTTSTAFLLYATEDYVTLRYSLSDTTWYVVATNGPVQTATQSSSGSLSTPGAWTAIANGFSLGTVAPGVYDIELSLTAVTAVTSEGSIGIGNVTSLISDAFWCINSNSVFPVRCGIKAYTLSASAVIQGIYYNVGGSGLNLLYNATYCIGKITLRRVG